MLLADQLLHADNLHGQRAFVHETSAKSKALQAAWRAAIELSGKVGAAGGVELDTKEDGSLG